VGVCQRSQYCRSEVAQHGKPLTLLATTWVRRIVFAQKLAPSVGGEALKKVVKKRQDFGTRRVVRRTTVSSSRKVKDEERKRYNDYFFLI